MPNASLAEPLCVHEIEPFLRGPLPRAVRLSRAFTLLIACAAMFCAASVWIAASALTGAAQLVWLHARGHGAMAHVSEIVFQDGRRGSPTLEPVEEIAGVVYRYRTEEGAERQGVSVVSLSATDWRLAPLSDARAARLKAERLAAVRRLLMPGCAWRVRYAPWGDGMICEPWAEPPLGKMLFLAAVGWGILGCGAFFIARLARWMKSRLRLLRHGDATVGTILHKRTDAEDAPKFFIRYGYACGSRTCEHEERCSPDQWRRFHVGDPVTVLCNPDEPGIAALYRLLPFTHA